MSLLNELTRQARTPSLYKLVEQFGEIAKSEGLSQLEIELHLTHALKRVGFNDHKIRYILKEKPRRALERQKLLEQKRKSLENINNKDINHFSIDRQVKLSDPLVGPLSRFGMIQLTPKKYDPEHVQKIRVAVPQVFRELLPLKGAKIIYANIVVDTKEMKYICLEAIEPNKLYCDSH
jgi:hypothetical protein